MPMTPLSTPPSRDDSEDVFVARSNTLLSELPGFVTEANALEVQVDADAAAAAASQVAAASSASDSAASATAAAASAGVAKWISGTTYAIGDARWSPLSFMSYRRKTAGAGTTDPSLDTTNWQVLNSITISSGRRRTINGNFSTNQRGLSGTVTLTAGQYGHDGWKAGAGGCTYTFATSGADTVITISAGSLMQVHEGAYNEGGFYTLYHTGTANARVAINGASTSGAYAAAPLTTSSATGGQDITVEFTTGTVSKVQLEPGTAPTSYEYREANDMFRCQRIGYPLMDGSQSNETLGFGYHTSTTNIAIWRPIPEMRAVPSLTFLSGTQSGTLNSFAGSTTITAVAVNASGSTKRLLQLSLTGTGLTAGAATYVKSNGSVTLKLFAECGP